MKFSISIGICLLVTLSSFSQTKDAYETGEKSGTELFSKSRLSIQHSVNFGMMSTSGISNLKSQSLYNTMLQYQFMAPITVQVNFGLPIHSTVSSAHNLSIQNVQSMDYFKSMPIDFNLSWKPTAKTQFTVSFVNNTYRDQYNYFNGLAPMYHPYESASDKRDQR